MSTDLPVREGQTIVRVDRTRARVDKATRHIVALTDEHGHPLYVITARLRDEWLIEPDACQEGRCGEPCLPGEVQCAAHGGLEELA